MSRYEHYIFSPDDTFLKDEAWLATQPAGTVETIIANKPDTFLGTVSFAPGEGRNGKNAIRMTTESQTTTGLGGGIWLYPQGTDGLGTLQDPSTDKAFIIPRNKRVNRLEVWIRCPPGFKINGWENNYVIQKNFHWGTYCARPAGLTGVGTPTVHGSGSLVMFKEMSFSDGIIHGTTDTTGWHYYHEPRIRHDVASNGEWVRLVFHNAPGHIRGDGGDNIQVFNPQASNGDFFKCLTRMYLDFVESWTFFDGGGNPLTFGGPASEPNIPLPFDVFIDSIRFFWHDEYQPCEIRFGSNGDWLDGQEIEVSSAPAVNDIPFRVTNITDTTVSGRLAWRGRFQHDPIIVPVGGGASFHVGSITLTPGETKDYLLRISPSVGDSNYPENIGVVFEPASEFVGIGATNVSATWGQSCKSKWDPTYVLSNSVNGIGGVDLDCCYRSITFIRNGGSNTTYRPTSRGGLTYRVPVTATSQFQLSGHDPGGNPITFTKMQSEAGRGTLSISSTGMVTYTPPSPGWTGTCHFSYQLNTGTSKPSIFYGAWVEVFDGAQAGLVGGNKFMLTAGSRIATIG